MKRLLSITLALSLIGSSSAMAYGYQGGGYRAGSHSYSAPYRGGYGYRDHSRNAAAAVGVGILALGLFAALASQNNRYSDGYYAPPPPRYGYGGYGGYGSTPSYGYGYGGGYYGYGR